MILYPFTIYNAFRRLATPPDPASEIYIILLLPTALTWIHPWPYSLDQYKEQQVYNANNVNSIMLEN